MTLLWMGVIFWFSAQNAENSSGMSGHLLQTLLSVLIPHWESRDEAERLAMIEGLHTIFRKCGHFSEYTVLGMLLTGTARQRQKCISESRQAVTKEVIFLPALCALFYACTDEFHQRFVPGRSCELRDVCIDFGGACLGILLVSVISFLIRRIAARRKHKNGKRKPLNSQ